MLWGFMERSALAMATLDRRCEASLNSGEDVDASSCAPDGDKLRKDIDAL
jgi:hypothetical protein